MTARPGPGATVEASVPGGPLLVRGARFVTDEEGAEHPVTRPVVAICRCGRSQRTPWCDATHKAVRSASRVPDAAEGNGG